MGLDIHAYETAELIAAPSEEETESGVLIYNDNAFKARADDLMDGGLYKVSGQDFDFGAGGYGGYNAWRGQLAKLAGYPERTSDDDGWRRRTGHDVGAWAASSGPFWELINFSDCEGVIGPKTSAKLAADFAEFDERASTFAGKEARFYDKYQEWRKAFEIAANTGLVKFF